jgi:hypothetical protein
MGGKYDRKYSSVSICYIYKNWFPKKKTYKF